MSADDLIAASVAVALHAREPISAAWGMVVQEVRQGFARVEMLLRADMLNGHATAHGGVIFTLADTAFAYACNSRNQVTVAAQASIIFLSPAHTGEVLIAEARELTSAGRSGAYSVQVRTVAGRAIAEFQGLSRTIGGAVVAVGQ